MSVAALARLTDLVESAPGRWGVSVIDLADRTRFALAGDRVLRSASSAKLLVLIAAALAIEHGDVDADEPLHRDRVAPVGDSGLWQHLRQQTLPIDDVARLVGAVSDNLATNVLIDRLGGVEEIARAATDWGIDAVDLHDIVRDQRGHEDPPTLSTGSADGYADLFARLWRGELGGRPVCDRALAWLGDGVDLSMVAGAWGLDPLAHTPLEDGAVRLWHKTGTDIGIRADSGLVAARGRVWAYACLVNFAETDLDRVTAVMRAIGDGIRDAM